MQLVLDSIFCDIWYESRVPHFQSNRPKLKKGIPETHADQVGHGNGRRHHAIDGEIDHTIDLDRGLRFGKLLDHHARSNTVNVDRILDDHIKAFALQLLNNLIIGLALYFRHHKVLTVVGDQVQEQKKYAHHKKGDTCSGKDVLPKGSFGDEGKSFHGYFFLFCRASSISIL